MRKLTVDEAAAQFYLMLREHLTPERLARSGSYEPETFEEAEAQRFRWAEMLLRLACKNAKGCTDHRCRRARRCRHLVELDALKQGLRRPPDNGCPPGAHAARHAMWVYANICLSQPPDQATAGAETNPHAPRGRQVPG